MRRFAAILLVPTATIFTNFCAFAADQRQLNEADNRALVLKIVSQFKKCSDLDGATVRLDSFLNKTDESLDKTHFAKLLAARLSKVKKTNLKTDDDAAVALPTIELSLESVKSEVNGIFHASYALTMTLKEHNESVCEGKARLKKSGRIH